MEEVQFGVGSIHQFIRVTLRDIYLDTINTLAPSLFSLLQNLSHCVIDLVFVLNYVKKKKFVS